MSQQTHTPTTQSRVPLIIAYALIILIAIILVQKGIAGIYRIAPGQEAAIQTFGKAGADTVKDEGLHWHWPSPIGKTTVIQTQQNRSTEVGFQSRPDGSIDMVTGEPWQRDLKEATMITGDLNIIEVQLVAQYNIKNLNSYLFRADDPGVVLHYVKDSSDTKVSTNRTAEPGFPDGQTIKDALEVAIRKAAGQRTLDEALITQRESIEQETLLHAQELLDAYRTGLRLTSIQLQEVTAPSEVQAAFDDVLRAREERDTRINEALAFESQVLPEARGQAEKIKREAEAYRAERANAAQGEHDRFLAILREYQAAPEIIGRRMLLETLDKVLPRLNQVIVPAGSNPIIITGGQGRTPVVPVPAQP